MPGTSTESVSIRGHLAIPHTNTSWKARQGSNNSASTPSRSFSLTLRQLLANFGLMNRIFKGFLGCLVIAAQFTGVLCDLHAESTHVEEWTTAIRESVPESDHSHSECDVEAQRVPLFSGDSLVKFKTDLQANTSPHNQDHPSIRDYPGTLLSRAQNPPPRLLPLSEFSILRI